MINFLVAIDIILAILIISSVFLHQGTDGFMGETTQSVPSQIKFETFDKIVGSLVIAFFVVTLLINYFTIYQSKGTADIDDIVERAEQVQKLKKAEASQTIDKPNSNPKAQDSDTPKDNPKTEAPLAQ